MKKTTFDKTRIKDDSMRLNMDTIRKYENPEFRRAAEEYEKMARDKNKKSRSKSEKEGNHFAAGSGAGIAAGSIFHEGKHLEEGYSKVSNSSKAAKKNASFSNRPKSLKQAERDEKRRQKNSIFGKRNKKSRSTSYERPQGVYGEGYGNSQFENGYGEMPGNGFSKNANKRSTKGARKGRKRRLNAKKVIRNIIVILLVLFLAFVVYFMGITSHLDKVKTSKDDFAIDAQVAKDLRGYRNIAILGVDARKGESLDGSRTDAIIIARIKKSNGDMQLISIMRDSYLKMEDNDGNLILDKITHAHHYGGGADTCAALNRSLDLNIDEFVIFNWQAVSDTVNTLGGIEVDVKKNEIRDLNKWGPETAENVGGTYNKITTTGKQTIDGVQATTYCRIRKTSGGDTGRGNRYKKVMSAVMKKAVSSPAKLNKLSKEVLPEIRTNMSQFGLLSAVLRAPGYQIDKSYGWPKNYYGGLLGNGIWYAVPRTLDSNVKWLHKKAFEQENYVPSSTSSDISKEIIYYTGIQ